MGVRAHSNVDAGNKGDWVGMDNIITKKIERESFATNRQQSKRTKLADPSISSNVALNNTTLQPHLFHCISEGLVCKLKESGGQKDEASHYASMMAD